MIITAPTPVLKDSTDQTEVRKAFSDLSRSISVSSVPIQPISSIIGSSQIYTLTSGTGMQSVFIPLQFLVSSASSTTILTIQSNVSGTSVTVPIAPSGSTITSGPLFFNIYIDPQGNVTSSDFSILGTTSNGNFEYKQDGVLIQTNSFTQVNLAMTTALGNLFYNGGIGVATFPVPFVDTTYSIIGSADNSGLSNFEPLNRPSSKLTNQISWVVNSSASITATTYISWTANGKWK